MNEKAVNFAIVVPLSTDVDSLSRFRETVSFFDSCLIPRDRIAVTLVDFDKKSDRTIVDQLLTLGVRVLSDPVQDLAHLLPPEAAAVDGSGAAVENESREEPPVVVKVFRLRLVKELEERAQNAGKNTPSLNRAIVEETLKSLMARDEDHLSGLSLEERQQVFERVMHQVVGLGPLEELMADDSLSEVMVRGINAIWVEEKGKLRRVEQKFKGLDELSCVIERIVSPLGRRVDESVPLCDARLADGSRVNIIIPPVALDGPEITIRKFRKTHFTGEEMVRMGAMTTEMLEFLKECVKHHKSLLVSGGTGSGKTTLLNLLSSFIGSDERIVTIEDAAELRLQQDHVVRLEARPPNLEGTGAVPIRQLLINSLRMRPDRIIIGECRGAEALDLLQALNTGHKGSLTTLHANSPREALGRLEVLALMAGIELPLRAIREQIRGGVDVIVQASRLRDGSRKIVSIAEVTGMEGDVISLSELYSYVGEGDGGCFETSGLRPQWNSF